MRELAGHCAPRFAEVHLKLVVLDVVSERLNPLEVLNCFGAQLLLLVFEELNRFPQPNGDLFV